MNIMTNEITHKKIHNVVIFNSKEQLKKLWIYYFTCKRNFGSLLFYFYIQTLKGKATSLVSHRFINIRVIHALRQFGTTYSLS